MCTHFVTSWELLLTKGAHPIHGEEREPYHEAPAPLVRKEAGNDAVAGHDCRVCVCVCVCMRIEADIEMLFRSTRARL